MHENDYTFVTLDTSEEAPLLNDAVVVDVEGDGGILEAVMLDDVQADSTDFITLSDDTVMMIAVADWLLHEGVPSDTMHD